MKKTIKILCIAISSLILIAGIVFSILMCSKKPDNSNEIKSDYYENSDVKLTIDQKDFTTTESLQTITGTYNPNSDIQSIEYKIEDFNKSEIEKGTAKIDNGKWSIKEILLVPDKNYITVTAYTSDGKTISANIVINYSNGYDYDYSDSNIITDKDSGISFVDNIILIYFKDNITEARKIRIVKSINAEVVGKTNALNLYQVKTEKFKSLKEIKRFCDELMNLEEVSEATYDLISELDLNGTSYKMPSDPWTNKDDIQDWNEDQPSGNNWWCEAIKLPSTWKYNERFNNINIGIADVGFQTNHEDLNVTFPNTDWENKNKLPNSFLDDPSHGTHVAGIIRATANNNTGITGIAWNSKLICCDIQPNFKEKLFTNTSSTKRLIQSITSAVEAKSKVINYSWGYNSNASKTEVNESAYRISRVMSILLSRYDFLIVQSAGNLSITAEKNGFFCSINKDNCYSGKNSVPYDEIKNRIIIVGAVENDGNSYKLAKYSNYGNNVDITAPGTDIYSTVVDGYGYMTGTSMAAPMVTGVAGLVWSINPNFTGAEVKEIVCNSVDTSVSGNPDNALDGYTYKLLNAKLSVETAIEKTDGYLYNCNVKFVDSNTKLTIPAKCTVYKATDEIGESYEKYRYVDYCETFYIELPKGIYQIDVTPLDDNHEKTRVVFTQSDSLNTHIINIDKKVTATSKPANSTTYVNEEYGWSVELPEEWNKYGFIVDNSVNPMLLTGADTVNFCHKEMYNSYGDGGIFSILACPLEDYHNISDSSFYKKITENAEYVYLYHEFEIQFDTPLSSEKYDILLNEYNILHKAKDSILESFKLLN